MTFFNLQLAKKSSLLVLLLFVTVAGKPPSNKENSDSKSSNLRSLDHALDRNIDLEHRHLEDGISNEEEFGPSLCAEGICDAGLDPITTPQFKRPNVPKIDPVNPFCIDFNTLGDTEGFAPCPGIYDNIAVNVFDAPYNPDDPTNPLRGDYYLHVRDMSGASLACGTDSNYTGDWTDVTKTKCHNLCFDVNLFHDGCTQYQTNCERNETTGGYFVEVFPTLILQGGPPNFYRAAFRADQYMTDTDGDNPGWRRICAPLTPLDSHGNLPENEHGKWHMATSNNILSGLPGVTGPPAPNSAWPDLLSNIAAIQLPVDFTANPAERVGYDHICIEDANCTETCDPEPLCYWKSERACQEIQDEEWYPQFQSSLESIKTFDSKSLCICSALNGFCPDLCALAEQEFLALLLNIASGYVSPTCHVDKCGECSSNVKDIVKLVDRLLAFSARSDYDCSKALHYLTGINHNETLCEEQEPKPCEQTKLCQQQGGQCVSQEFCQETMMGNDGRTLCLPDMCMDTNCVCMIMGPPPPPPSCPNEKRCVALKGQCMSIDRCLKEIGSDEVCDPHLCGELRPNMDASIDTPTNAVQQRCACKRRLPKVIGVSTEEEEENIANVTMQDEETP